MSIIELTTRKGQRNYSSDFKREKGTQGIKILMVAWFCREAMNQNAKISIKESRMAE